MGDQFRELISSNFKKCPGCDRRYVTDSSPVSSVDNKTKICDNCSVGEATRAALEQSDPSAVLKGPSQFSDEHPLHPRDSLYDLLDNYPIARGLEYDKKQAKVESDSHAKRIMGSKIPVPEPTKIGKFNITYDRESNLPGAIHAKVDHPNGWVVFHSYLLPDTGEVYHAGSHGWYDTYPQHVQKHITSVLTRHYKKYAKDIK